DVCSSDLAWTSVLLVLLALVVAWGAYTVVRPSSQGVLREAPMAALRKEESIVPVEQQVLVSGGAGEEEKVRAVLSPVLEERASGTSIGPMEFAGWRGEGSTPSLSARGQVGDGESGWIPASTSLYD